MKKIPEPPQELIDWRHYRSQPEPKCCHTCDFYDETGHCNVFDTRPPDDFTRELDACKEYLGDIPF